MKPRMIFYYILFLFVASDSLCAQTSTANKCGETARLFVKHFYDWYVPLANREAKEPASSVAIRERGGIFSRDLLALLKEDGAAGAKANGYIVGLDFDPFLNSQDPSDQYDVGDITPKSDGCLVSIFATRYGERSTQPDVVAEISYRHARWAFIDFHYPESGEDLIQVLQALRQDRSASAK